MFVIEVGSDSALPLVVALHGEAGDCSRYYPPLVSAETNAILLSTLGFLECDSSQNLSGVTLTFIRSELESDATVEIGRVIVFDDRAQLKNWFDEIAPVLPEEEEHFVDERNPRVAAAS
jgi:hypothetical protein